MSSSSQSAIDYLLVQITVHIKLLLNFFKFLLQFNIITLMWLLLYVYIPRYNMSQISCIQYIMYILYILYLVVYYSLHHKNFNSLFSCQVRWMNHDILCFVTVYFVCCSTSCSYFDIFSYHGEERARRGYQ